MTRTIEAHRLFLSERNFMLLEADFGPLFESQQKYLEVHGLRAVGPEALPIVRQTLQASVLWTTFLPNRSASAWSLLLAEQQWRLFAAADSGGPRCVIRWSPFEGEHQGHEQLFSCQSVRPGEKLQTSIFVPEARAFPALISEFFEVSQQCNGTMFFDTKTHAAQMLIALADWDQSWWAHLLELPPDRLVADHEFGERRPIGPPQPWIYECGCNPATLGKAILAAARNDIEAVFGDQDRVEVECPRCGREHRLTRPAV